MGIKRPTGVTSCFEECWMQTFPSLHCPEITPLSGTASGSGRRKVFIASACMLLKGLVFNNHVAWNSVAIFYRFTCCQIEGKKCWGGCASAVWRAWKGDFVYTVLQMDPFHPTKQDLSTFIQKVIRECLIYPLVCNQLRSLLFFLFFFYWKLSFCFNQGKIIPWEETTWRLWDQSGAGMCFTKPVISILLCRGKVYYSHLLCLSLVILRLNSMRSTSWLMPTGTASLTCKPTEMVPRLSGETHTKEKSEELSATVIN